MSKCPTCMNECDTTKSVIRGGKLFEGCDKCLSSQIQQGDSASFNRKWQQGEYRKELTQPNQREFARAYPKEFRERYGDELYRTMG